MKHRHIIFILSITSMVIAGFVLKQCGASTSKPKMSTPLGIDVVVHTPTVAEQPKVLAGGQATSQILPRPPSPEDVLNRHNLGASGFDTKVRFWGKVLDQDGTPVEGASIKASVTTLRMIEAENGYREFEPLEAQSKADGTFMLEGAAGFALTIEKLTKPGYVLPSPYQIAMRFPEDFKHRYAYAPMAGAPNIFNPDPASPVIFRMWKLRNPEPMTMWGSWAGFDGPEYALGAKAKNHTMALKLNPYQHGYGPDISIDVTSVGTEQAPQWEVAVTAIEEDGGVAKAKDNDTFMFEAPVDGYVRSLRFRYGPDIATKHGDGMPVRFFVRSKKGRWYSAADLIFLAPDANGVIFTKWRNWLNPNGSRNLEHDAAHPMLMSGF